MAELIVLLLIGFTVAVLVLVMRSPNRIRIHSDGSPLSAQVKHPKQQKMTKNQQLLKIRSSKVFWGVSIRPGTCKAIRQYTDRKFELDEVPDLPLPDCDSERCTCQYIGLKQGRESERRSSAERRNEIRFEPDHPDRRSGNDHRKSNETWKAHDF